MVQVEGVRFHVRIQHCELNRFQCFSSCLTFSESSVPENSLMMCLAMFFYEVHGFNWGVEVSIMIMKSSE